MNRLPSPEVGKFFENRLIVSWNITQPPDLPSLEDVQIQISGKPPLTFEPLQDPQLIIPKLDGNDFIVNWVFYKPSERTKLILTIGSEILSEEHHLIIDPMNYNETE